MIKEKRNKGWCFLLFLLVVLMGFLSVVVWKIWPVARVFIDPIYESMPPKVLPLDNKNMVYVITYDFDLKTGIYVIYPVGGVYNENSITASEKHPAYISSSPVSLEQFLDKKVKITGEMVWTYDFLRRPGFSQPKGVVKGAAVRIDSITLAE